jgi:hypothetical protein
VARQARLAEPQRIEGEHRPEAGVAEGRGGAGTARLDPVGQPVAAGHDVEVDDRAAEQPGAGRQVARKGEGRAGAEARRAASLDRQLDPLAFEHRQRAVDVGEGREGSVAGDGR